LKEGNMLNLCLIRLTSIIAINNVG
jgi:hypothetical protein